MHKFITGAFNIIVKIESFLCITMIVSMTAMCFIQIVYRYMINPIFIQSSQVLYLNDLSLYMFIFFMALSMGVAAHYDIHTVIDIFLQKKFANNPRGRKKYILFTNCVLLVSLLFFVRPGLVFARRYLTRAQMSSVIPWFNESWNIVGFGFALILLTLHFIFKVYIGFYEILHEKTPNEAPIN